MQWQPVFISYLCISRTMATARLFNFTFFNSLWFYLHPSLYIMHVHDLLLIAICEHLRNLVLHSLLPYLNSRSHACGYHLFLTLSFQDQSLIKFKTIQRIPFNYQPEVTKYNSKVSPNLHHSWFLFTSHSSIL